MFDDRFGALELIVGALDSAVVQFATAIGRASDDLFESRIGRQYVMRPRWQLAQHTGERLVQRVEFPVLVCPWEATITAQPLPVRWVGDQATEPPFAGCMSQVADFEMNVLGNAGPQRVVSSGFQNATVDVPSDQFFLQRRYGL